LSPEDTDKLLEIARIALHALEHFNGVGFVHEHAADLCIGYVDAIEYSN